MVKVVGVGKKYVYETECKYCASILEYTKIDCKDAWRFDYSGSTERYTVIICPNCNHNIEVSLK